MRIKLFYPFIFAALLGATLFIIFRPAQAAHSDGVIYVDVGAVGAASGVSWTDAYTNVQDALAHAVSSDQIWVAQGVYYPDEGSGQTNNNPVSTFSLQNGVTIYGGFVGSETQLSQRDPAANVTVLSGDIDGNDSTDANGVVTDPGNIAGNNAYRVVTGSSTDNTAILDGFTVTAGQATNVSYSSGGGMYNNSGSPVLTNVTFSGNEAGVSGGGMDSSGSPVLSNVTFINNAVGNSGGGMANSGNPVLTNVTFSGNTAGNSGGGMYNSSGSSALTNVIIANSANGDCVNSGGVSLNPASQNNLIKDSGANACGLISDVNGNIVGQDPNLGPLTDYGGSGRQTFPLLPGSPAIDAGTNTGCPAEDQRGAARPISAACDIGAYEAGYSLAVAKSVNDAAPAPGQTITFTIVVTSTGPVVSGWIISDTLSTGLNFLGPITLDDPSGTGIAGSAPPLLAAGLLLPSGSAVTVTFPVTVSYGLTQGTVLTNTMAVSAAQLAAPVTDAVVITVQETNIYLPLILRP